MAQSSKKDGERRLWQPVMDYTWDCARVPQVPRHWTGFFIHCQLAPNMQLLNKQTNKKNSHLIRRISSITCPFFFLLEPESLLFLCNFRSYEWFMVLLELKSTKTIHNCEQSLLLLEGNAKASALPKNTWGRIPVWKWNGCVFPLELNLPRWISGRLLHSPGWQSGGGHQDVWFLPSPPLSETGIQVVTLCTLLSTY